LKKKYPEQPQQIEIMFLLGQQPQSDNPDKIYEQLHAVDARFIAYDDLIKMTRNSYRDYLERDKKIAKIAQLVDAI
jgi:regulator of sigma D